MTEKNTLTSEQISYIREWANSGNEPRLWDGDLGYQICFRHRSGTFSLSEAALTIAALAEVLECACETVDLMYNATENRLLSFGDKDALKAMREKKKELLG